MLQSIISPAALGFLLSRSGHVDDSLPLQDKLVAFVRSGVAPAGLTPAEYDALHFCVVTPSGAYRELDEDQLNGIRLVCSTALLLFRTIDPHTRDFSLDTLCAVYVSACSSLRSQYAAIALVLLWELTVLLQSHENIEPIRIGILVLSSRFITEAVSPPLDAETIAAGSEMASRLWKENIDQYVWNARSVLEDMSAS